MGLESISIVMEWIRPLTICDAQFPEDLFVGIFNLVASKKVLDDLKHSRRVLFRVHESQLELKSTSVQELNVLRRVFWWVVALIDQSEACKVEECLAIQGEGGYMFAEVGLVRFNSFRRDESGEGMLSPLPFCTMIRA